MHRENKRVILYGCGEYARAFFRDFEYYKSALINEISFIVDDDISKIGTYFFGKRIESNDILRGYKGTIVIGTHKHNNEIEQHITAICSTKDITLISLPYFLNHVVYLHNILPEAVKIESSSLCQLDCKECYMRKEHSGTIGKGYLSFENFKKFLLQNQHIKRVELSNNGEMFLNPDLLQIIKYAYDVGVKLTARNGVNFNDVSDEILEALVKYQFECITLSIDGATQEAYSSYRRKGDINKVLDNVRKLLKYKEKYHSDFPRLRWQYIIMECTEKDIGKAKEIAQELGIPISFKLTWDKNYVPKDREYISKETGLLSLTTKEYTLQTSDYYGSRMCNQIFIEPQINWDGRLLGCCAIYQADFGVNVFEVGLEAALSSSKFEAAREMVLNPSGIYDKDNPCAMCDVQVHRRNIRSKQNDKKR